MHSRTHKHKAFLSILKAGLILKDMPNLEGYA